MAKLNVGKITVRVEDDLIIMRLRGYRDELIAAFEAVTSLKFFELEGGNLKLRGLNHNFSKNEPYEVTVVRDKEDVIWEVPDSDQKIALYLSNGELIITAASIDPGDWEDRCQVVCEAANLQWPLCDNGKAYLLAQVYQWLESREFEPEDDIGTSNLAEMYHDVVREFLFLARPKKAVRARVIAEEFYFEVIEGGYGINIPNYLEFEWAQLAKLDSEEGPPKFKPIPRLVGNKAKDILQILTLL